MSASYLGENPRPAKFTALLSWLVKVVLFACPFDPFFELLSIVLGVVVSRRVISTPRTGGAKVEVVLPISL